MSYSITTTSGGPVATVQDGTINTTATALTLIGRDYAGYGAFLNENFVHLLENFAANTAPTRRLSGQIWWDTSVNSLKVWNQTANVWKPVGSTITQEYPGPATLTSTIGDLWFDTTNKQLNVFDQSTNAWLLVGPPNTLAGSGAIVTKIKDSSAVDHNVLEFKVNNNIVGIISYDATFTPQTTLAGFPIIKPGLNLVNSLALSGSQFTGDASNALFLNGVSANQFLRSDQNTSTAYQLTVQAGVTVGANLILAEDYANKRVTITSAGSNQDLNFYINNGGINKAIGINGATGLVSLIYDTTVGGALTSTGAFTVTGPSTTTLGGVTTFNDNLLPTSDNSVKIGLSNQKFQQVFASTFVGNLINGNVTATTATVSGWANAAVGMAVAGSPVSTFANVQSYVQYAGRNSQGNKYISTSTPTGGSNGDIWYQI